MDKNIKFYFDKQNEKRRLIHTIGILWSKISSDLDSAFAEFNLNVSKFNILMVIKHSENKDGIRQNEISKKLLVTASNITKLLDRLEKEELITRNSQSGDKRVKLIKITQKADKLLDKAWIKYIDKVNNLTKNISSEDCDFITRKLLKFIPDNDSAN